LRGARGATAVVTSSLFSVSCWGIDLMTLSCSTTVKHARCFPPHRAHGVTSLAERVSRCTKWVVHPSSPAATHCAGKSAIARLACPEETAAARHHGETSVADVHGLTVCCD
jgi:hypothetical protein